MDRPVYVRHPTAAADARHSVALADGDQILPMTAEPVQSRFFSTEDASVSA